MWGFSAQERGANTRLRINLLVSFHAARGGGSSGTRECLTETDSSGGTRAEVTGRATRGEGKVCKLGGFTAQGTGAADSHQACLKGLRENNDTSVMNKLNLLFRVYWMPVFVVYSLFK